MSTTSSAVVPLAPVRGLATHGGDLDAIVARHGGEAGDYLDLSANLDPLGPPHALLEALAVAARDVASLRRYPEPTSARLRAALARRRGVPADAIVVGNGAAALLETALAEPRVRTCVLPVPAFSEHRRALAALGIAAVPLPLEPAEDFALDAHRALAAVRASGADALLLANPHNPSGSLLAADAMRALVAELAALGCRTILDEAFIEYAPGGGLTADAIAHASLVVIRSLTKFYAAPALRVGYAVLAPARAAALRARLPSWPVTTLAARALEAALGDTAYDARALAGNRDARIALASELRRLGCHVVPSAANFILAELPTSAPPATAVAAWLARERRVVVRDCSTYDGLEHGRWIRVAARGLAERTRAVAALRDAIAAC